ncbi:FAD-dependent oxidoreductase [archaeon]|jgi:thioredoxin reductase (NADPH)|nr:FAD-dependent oxidoreductase [archaeon]MBT4397645.1 FAD-dependent oxidoreductase [archaeon]MBT4441659.1 FAD-dependent oxidoreductase [archaeon]
MYDLIIIGGGPAGLGAGMYAGRYRMKTLLISPDRAGTLAKGHLIENYLGYKSIAGIELGEKFIEHVESHETVEFKDGVVDKLEKKGERFVVHVDGETFESKTLFLGLGMQHRNLGVKGEDDFAGKGVSYCYNCDAPLFGGKTVVVVGGGDSAVNGVALLTEYADKVYMLVRSKVRAEPVNYERIKDHKKVEIMLKEEIAEVKGDKFVNEVVLKSGKSLKVDGVFVEIGYVPANELIKEVGLEANEWGFLEVNDNMETSVKGVFAGGDLVAQNTIKQVISAVADGCTAAIAAYKLITTKKEGGKLR